MNGTPSLFGQHYLIDEKLAAWGDDTQCTTILFEFSWEDLGSSIPGRRDVMQMVAPAGPMYQAGTLAGNPLAMTAGIETLKELQKPGAWERGEMQLA